MSGIAGVFHCADGRPVAETELQHMLQAIAHRGPDGGGAWVSGPIGLGHRMLWTTPESLQEQQPLSNEEGSLQLVADARVDNRDELRTALVAQGASLRSDTDAELILRSYEVWGENCPARILGDFAFAIWDSCVRQLFCARDPLGIKPLFYHFDGTAFRCGSAPDALFGDGAIPRELNLRLISRFLLNRFEDREETLYQGILRLPPAHSLVVQGDRLRKQRYWGLDPSHTVRYRTDEEYVEHFLELFRTAVSARLRSHGPVGAFLSGGLDSSSIVCLAEDLVRNNGNSSTQLEAYSIVFDQMDCDERSYIEEVDRKCNVRAIQFRQDDEPAWLDFELTDRYRDCIYAPTLFMMGPALMHAGRNHVRAVLTGIGGDDMMSSSIVHLTDLLRQRRIADLFQQLKHDSELTSRSQWSLFRDYCLRPLLPRPVRAVGRFLLRSQRNGSKPDWVTNKCLASAELSEYMGDVDQLKFPTAAQQLIHDKLESGWTTNVALGRIDSFVSHFSMECRHPFFDRRIVEFMMAVPEEHRWSGPQKKTLLRRAMAGILPEPIRCRNTKADFTPLVNRELTERQARKVEELLQNSVLGGQGLIDVPKFRELFAKFRQSPGSHRTRKACETVIGLELWCRAATGQLRNRSQNEQ